MMDQLQRDSEHFETHTMKSGSPDIRGNSPGTHLESIEEDCQNFDDHGVFNEVRRTETTFCARSKNQIESKIGYGKNTPQLERGPLHHPETYPTPPPLCLTPPNLINEPLGVNLTTITNPGIEQKHKRQHVSRLRSNNEDLTFELKDEHIQINDNINTTLANYYAKP